MSGESEISAYNAGARGGIPVGVAAEDMAAFHAGVAAHRAGGGRGGGGGGGGLLLIPFLLMLPIALVAGTCFYPLPGLLTLLGGALLSDLMSGVSGLGMLLFLMLPCVGIFFAGLALERWLERRAWYRQLRHAARIVIVGFVAHVIVFAFNGAGEFSRHTSLFDRLSISHVLLVLAAMVAAHFASRRLDARLGSAQGFFQRFGLRRKTPAPTATAPPAQELS